MSMSDLDSAFELIDANAAVADFAGPKSEELIGSAQAALGLTFPSTYREFVRRLGCGGIHGEEFYGVINENFDKSSVPDAIWLTLDERRRFNLPEWLIIVADNGLGGGYAIDTSQKNPSGENPVVDWWPSQNMKQFVAEDFGAFLLQRINQAIL